MKKTKSQFCNKLISLFLSILFVVSVISVIPHVNAVSPVLSDAYIRQLVTESPLSEGQVYVGFGQESIMPSSGVPLAGYGLTQNRLSEVGGSNADYEKEIFSSCVAIMDSKGSIVLFSTNDVVGIAEEEVAAIRKAVTAATGIAGNRVMISGTHTHSAPDTTSTNSKVKAAVDDYNNNVFIPGIVTACVEAVQNLAPASMSTASTEATITSNGSEYALNFVRHYDTNVYDFKGNSIVRCDNHGAWYWDGTKWVTTSSSQYTGHTTVADGEMQIIKFERNNTSLSQNDIIMVNWQAHPTMVGDNSSSVVSADFIGFMRDKVVADLGCDFAYYTGAAGNINPRTLISSEGVSGITISTGSTSAQKTASCKRFGEALAACVIAADSAGLTPTNGGEVSAKQQIFVGNYKSDLDSTIKAANYISKIWNSTDAVLKKMILGTYSYSSTESAYLPTTFTIQEVILSDTTLKNAIVESSSGNEITAVKTGTISQSNRNRICTIAGTWFQSKEGNDVLIESPYHANGILARKSNTTYSFEINAITIGGVSFVTAPFEMFDTNGEYIKDNKTNAMTFVLAYTNGKMGYVPSAYGHSYTCYEADSTKTCQGDGEKIAGALVSLANDVVFEGKTYLLSTGEEYQIQAPYTYTDNFDYEYYGTKVNDSNLARFSYSENVLWITSDENVATVQNGKITAVGKGTATISVLRDGAVVSCKVNVGDHYHCDVCGELGCTDSTHEKYDYTAWTSSDSLPTAGGHYYLTSDVQIVSNAAEITKDRNIVLCLNGHKITSSGTGVYNVNANANLTICDCKKSGTISLSSPGTSAATGGLINVNAGNVRLLGGTFDAANSSALKGGTVYIKSGASLEVAGAKIFGSDYASQGGAVYVENTATLTVSAGTVSGGVVSDAGGTIYTQGTVNITGGKVECGTALHGGNIYAAAAASVNISGGSVEGGLASGTENSGGNIYLDSSSNAVMTGGTLSGGCAISGGSVYVKGGATFTLEDGIITSGETLNSTANGYGGNVLVASSGHFTMNGGTITSGISYGMGGNVNVSSGGNFVMNGGTIESGTAYTFTDSNNKKQGGHGGNVFCSGSFTLNKGVVTDGVSNACGGGNFSVNGSSSHLVMNGGTVKNGSSTVAYRGNIYIWYNAGSQAFIMNGGTITDDSSLARTSKYYGGGVYLEGTNSAMTVSGNAKISGNMKTRVYDEDTGSTSRTYIDVYLCDGKTINMGNLSYGASIGVTMENNGVFAVGASDYQSYFFANDEGYEVSKVDGDLAIAALGTDTTPVPEPPYVDDFVPEQSEKITDGKLHFHLEKNSSLDISGKFSGSNISYSMSSNYASVNDSGIITANSTQGVAVPFTVNVDGTLYECVVAVGHYHCLECGTYGCTLHNNVLFTATTSLPGSSTGNYYLSSDISTTAQKTINASNLTVNFCLNGHTVTGGDSNRIYAVNNTTTTVNNTVFSLCDCSEEQTGTLKANAKKTVSSGTVTDADYWNDKGTIFWVSTNSATSVVNIYSGILDASGVNLKHTEGGCAINTCGTVNVYGGKIIGGTASASGSFGGGGAVYVGKTGVFNFYDGIICGGTVRCLASVSSSGSGSSAGGGGNVLIYGGTFNMYGGTIYGGKAYGTTVEYTTSEGTVSTYSGMAYGGNIYVKSVSTDLPGELNISGGVIHGGRTDASHSGRGGNIAIFGLSTSSQEITILNMSGGVIEDGAVFGIAGNIYTSGRYSGVNMSGGVIRDGLAYSAPSGGDGHGGNVYISGGFAMSGDTVVSGGMAYGHGGGNFSVNTYYSLLSVSGNAVVKNGVCKSSYIGAGNIYIWNNAGRYGNIAFNMSGGTVTDDEDFALEDGFTAGGVRVSGNYDNCVRISGSAKIQGNLGYNLYIDSGHHIIVGTMSQGADVKVFIPSSQVFAENVDNTSEQYFKSDIDEAVIVYEETTSEIQFKKYQYYGAVKGFIDNYFTVNGTPITAASVANYKQILFADKIWNSLSLYVKEEIDIYIKHNLEASESFEEMVLMAFEYRNMLNVKVVRSTVDIYKFYFFSTVDDIDNYVQAGFCFKIYDTLFTAGTHQIPPEDQSLSGSPSDWSSISSYILNGGFYAINEDFGQTLTVWSFVKLQDGTVVTGEKTSFVITANDINKGENGDISNFTFVDENEFS